MRRLPLDFRDQYFGCEIELTGINRATAAQTLADLFGTRAEHSGGGYDAYRVKDLDGKEWKIVRDGSIHPECRRRSVLIGETYKVELNSPKLEYGEMEKLQEVVRSLRRAGGIVNDSCGMHVHVDPRSRKILHFAITQVVGKKLIETIVINRSNAINFTAAHCSRAKNLVQCIHVTPCMAHSTVKSLIYSVDIDSEVLKQKLLCSFTAISGRG